MLIMSLYVLLGHAAEIKSFCEEYHKRIFTLEGEKFDLEYFVARKDFEVRLDHLDRLSYSQKFHLLNSLIPPVYINAV